MSKPKVTVIEGPPAMRCAYCARWAARVIELNGERLCGPCESLFRKVQEAERQGDALQTSLLQAQTAIEAAQASSASYCRQVIQTREVARWLLAEWTDPANWSEAIDAAKARFGMLDWLREKEGAG